MTRRERRASFFRLSTSQPHKAPAAATLLPMLQVSLPPSLPLSLSLSRSFSRSHGLSRQRCQCRSIQSVTEPCIRVACSLRTQPELYDHRSPGNRPRLVAAGLRWGFPAYTLGLNSDAGYAVVPLALLDAPVSIGEALG